MDVCDYCKHQVVPDPANGELTHKATNLYSCYPRSNNPHNAARNAAVAQLNGKTHVKIK
jgi:hypothetical protein